jgi:transposase
VTKLYEEELVCAEVLTEKAHWSVRATAQELGVAESTLRYRLGRRAAGATDGRAQQAEVCQAFAAVIAAWMADQPSPPGRPESIQSLFDTLVSQHGFTGSYQSLRRYVRRRWAPPPIHPIRRVEVMPGSQAQVDWVEPTVYVHELGGWTRLNGFNLTPELLAHVVAAVGPRPDPVVLAGGPQPRLHGRRRHPLDGALR